jgi:guanine deaminase
LGRAKKFFYGADRNAAAVAGFDDAFIYNELSRSPDRRTISGYRLPVTSAQQPFDEWLKAANKIRY